jgi:hypothetical protein
MGTELSRYPPPPHTHTHTLYTNHKMSCPNSWYTYFIPQCLWSEASHWVQEMGSLVHNEPTVVTKDSERHLSQPTTDHCPDGTNTQEEKTHE